MSDSTVIQKAREWVDRLNSGTGLGGTWRLQRIDRRVRVNADESYDSSDSVEIDQLPVRIRRFCNACPWSLLNEALKYLNESAPYKGLVYNGVSLDGTYVPVRSWWERDEQTTVDKGRAVEGTYTLIQDLVEINHLDTVDFNVGSCSEDVSYEYIWDAPSVKDVGSPVQGETVSIQAMSRSEDGTFSYAIVRRKAKTQYSGESVSKCDEFETVKTETWNNLYGNPEDGFTDENGTAQAVPEPCDDRSSGRLVEVSVRENDDCTYQVTAQTTISNNKTSSVETTATQFERKRTVVDRAESESFDSVTEASGGIIRLRKSELRQDGRYDNTEQVHEEISVDSAVVEKRKTLRAVKTSTVNRNQVSAPDITNLSLGETYRIEKTDGGRYNVTHEETASESVGEIRTECQKTQFQHVHSTTANRRTDPGSDASTAGDGKVHVRTVARTEEGTFDVTDETRQEISVDSAVVEKHKTLRAVKTSTVNRNQISAPNITDLKLGETYRIEKTDGGRYNVTHEEIDSTTVGNTIRHVCQKTALEHTDVRTLSASEYPEDSCAESVDTDNRKIHSKTISANEDGTYDVEITDRTAVDKSWTVEVSTNLQYMYSVFFRHKKENEYKKLISDLESMCSQKVNSWCSQDRDPSGCGVTPAVEMDEFGLFNGHVTFNATWSASSAGQEGDVDETFASGYYTLSNRYGGHAGKQIFARGTKSLARYLQNNLPNSSASNFRRSFSFDPVSKTWNLSEDASFRND